MTILNEDMIVNRSKCSTLGIIKRLNFCGYNLMDVSVLKHLPMLELLSLSVNCISSLRPLQYLKNLEELYLRENQVADFNEVLYLQQLNKLRILSLEKNPICESSNYRIRILKMLPQLKKLDNCLIENEGGQILDMVEKNNHQLNNQTNANDLSRLEEVETLLQKQTQKQHEYVMNNQSNYENHAMNCNPYVPQQQEHMEITEGFNEIKRQQSEQQSPSKSNNQEMILCSILNLIPLLDDYHLNVVKVEASHRQRSHF